jgi:putative hydrolase of the HAD superfamily
MTDFSHLRAITLDLDDTLWPVWPTIARAEKALGDWLLVRAPLTAALFSDPVARQTLRDEVLAACPHWSHDLSALRLEALRQGLSRSKEDVTLATEAFEVFFAERQRVDLFADAEPALAALSARYPILAVSNGNADVHRVGLGAYFVGSVSAQSCGVAKPHVDIFHAAARALKLQPHEVLHVGDDAELDVLGALDAGMHTAWINRKAHTWRHPQTPHITATTMVDLCSALGVAV